MIYFAKLKNWLRCSIFAINFLKSIHHGKYKREAIDDIIEKLVDEDL